MIGYLVRVRDGWAAFSDNGERVGTAPLMLIDACTFFGVRRIMFGNYEIQGVKCEAWQVRPLILDQEQTDA